MPNLRIETNVSAEAIKDLNTCLAELSKAVSETTGKPEQYVVVQVVPGLPMIFAGSDAPCASAFFMSIGKIGPEENKVRGNIFFKNLLICFPRQAHAAAVYPIVEKYLGIPGDRMYILFRDAAYHEVAWKGSTFAALFGK